MKQKTKRRIQGSISVLLVIILLPSMVLSALIVDTSRINMAKSMVSGAGDLAMNSALANYDTILKDVYGLFAMSQDKTQEQLEEDIKKYFEDTLVSYGVVSKAEAGDYVGALMGDFHQLLTNTGSVDVSNFLKMEVGDDFKLSGVEASGLDNPQILRKQIVDYMKYRGPVNFGLSFLDSVKAFTVVEEQSKVVETQVAAQESLQPVTEGCIASIKAIREYDKLVSAINDGDKAVIGLQNSTDVNNKVSINSYHTQMDKYKDTWGENYKNINQLNLIFKAKVPEVSYKYLVSKSFANGELLIDNQGGKILIDFDNCGISIEVSCAADLASAKSQVEAQREKLSKEPYSTLAQSYCDANFLDRNYLNIEKTAFLNRDEAMKTFIKYEGFLLDNTDISDISYSEAKDTLEQLYTLYQYQTNYISLLDTAITNAESEKNAAETEKINKENAKNAAETALNNGKNASNATAAAKTVLENAKKACSAAEGTLKVAEKELEDYTGRETSQRYKELEEAVDAAQAVYDEKKEEQDAAQEAYDDCIDAEPTESELEQMETNYNNAVSAYNTAVTNYNQKVTQLENAKTEKTTAETYYQSCMSGYMTFAYEYQHDLELYGDYQSVAEKLMEKDAVAIYTQVTKIEENITLLLDQLNTIGICLSDLKGYIKTYDGKVDNWETANNQYESANTSDSFSKQNSSDIKATENQYNLESLEALENYLKVVEQEYRSFYDYITAADKFKYGTSKIDVLNTSVSVQNAVSQEVKDTLPQIVTVSDADGCLANLYSGGEPETPSIEIDKLTFVTDGVLPIQFLKYLNENFPETAHPIDMGNGDSNQGQSNTPDPKDQYNSIKENMKEDKEGQGKINSVDGNSFGYTFDKKGTIDKNGMPSQGKKEKTNSGKSMSISTDDKDNVNASAGMTQQTAGLHSVLGDVSKVLEAGMENIYLVDYIFQNFSYNTLVQDLTVEGRGYKTYPEVMDIASNEFLGEYKGSAKTLSNYNITGANNYLYGAEAEYILFGNSDPKKNVTYTKGSIYAIRFAFNCIYAFTDSGIRNTTMASGLAVQAATMGIVPYQVVQIVLQLALAAAESAVDLDMMSKGLKVAVVKTRDTWTLSVSGAVGLLGDVANVVIEEAAKRATTYIKEGINTVMEATAENLKGSVGNLTDTVTKAAKSKAQEIVDNVYGELQAELDSKLNSLQFLNFSYLDEQGNTVVLTQEEAKELINPLFTDLKNSVQALPEKYAGNPIAESLLPTIVQHMTETGGIIDSVHNEINDIVTTAYAEAASMGIAPDVGNKICEKMLQIKYDVIGKISDGITAIGNSVNRVVNDSITEITNELNESMQECVDDMSEEAADKIKEKVSSSLNNFSNKYLKDPGADIVELGTGGTGPGKTTGANVASMIKFGYKDYLMLLTFISVCVDDEAVLGRTADLIQLNMQNATGTPDKEKQIVFSHKKGKKFKMSEARTYVTIQTSVKLDMLFLNMDFFNKMLKDEETNFDEQMNAISSITYKGVSGY